MIAGRGWNNTCCIYTPDMPRNTTAALNLALLAVQELNLRALLGSFHLASTGCLGCFYQCKFDLLPAASSFLLQPVGKLQYKDPSCLAIWLQAHSTGWQWEMGLGPVFALEIFSHGLW